MQRRPLQTVPPCGFVVAVPLPNSRTCHLRGIFTKGAAVEVREHSGMCI